MWHFADLNDTQKLDRRRLLDHYGSLAQLVAVIPIASVQLYFLLCWAQARLQQWRAETKNGSSGGDGDGEPSSPYLKKERGSGRVRETGLVRGMWRRTAWWFGGRVEGCGVEAKRGEVVLSVVWMGLMLGLCMVQTENGMRFSFFHSDYAWSACLCVCARVCSWTGRF